MCKWYMVDKIVIFVGHYLELLRLIYDGKCEDNIRC